MKTGLLWFDDDPDRTTADKIKDGARRYYRKFKEVPNLVKIHPAAGVQIVSGLLIMHDGATLPHHFLIGRREEK